MFVQHIADSICSSCVIGIGCIKQFGNEANCWLC